jgi:aspartate/methionine/tyrosine aminotransferase
MRKTGGLAIDERPAHWDADDSTPPGATEVAMAMSARAIEAKASVDIVTAFLARVQSLVDDPGALDFTFGNPHELAVPGFAAALRAQIEPQSVDWFAYKTSEGEAQEAISAALRSELALPFEPEDIAMTQGAFGAISLALALLADAGDEVVIPVPGWFCYEPMLYAANLVPVRAPLDPDGFDLDVDAIARRITSRTRIVIVNSPANPTGRVYPKSTWDALADALERASRTHGRRIWILSDEPYRRIRFDGVEFASPSGSYPWTVIDYSYAKVLLAPGQRLGYLALSPLLPAEEREELRAALMPLGLAIGWGFPDAVMQYAVPVLETLSLDIAELTRKRDRMYGALTDAGVDVTRPEGTFYLWGKAPGGDGQAFCDALAERGVFLMPGRLFDQPHHFRISLTATMATIDRALPHIVDVARSLNGAAVTP